MVRTILRQDRVQVPEEVKMEVKSKIITVEGPKGILKKDFRKVPVQIIPEKDESGRVVSVLIRIWFAKNKPKSSVNTLRKHIQNMIFGVTKGFMTVMKFGFKFFAMKITAIDGGKALSIEKFAGENYVRKIKCVEGVTVSVSDDIAKKEIMVCGIDPEAVGLTCSLINQSCKYRDVDSRIFLDGIYIFERKFQDN